MGTVLDSYRKLFDSIAGDPPRRLYFLYGNEEFMKKEFVSALIKTALPEPNRAFNLDIFYGDEFERGLFDDRVSSFPLFADKRMVILKKFDALSLSNKDFVLSRLESIPEALTVVVESSADKMDNARLKTLKKLADGQGVSFQCKFLSEQETVMRAKARITKEGFAIEPDALELLVESVGTRLLDLVNEIDKITIIAQGQKTITRDMVKDVIGRYRTESVFGFLDRVNPRNITATIKSLNLLLDGGEEPVFILAMLLRRTLQLMQVTMAAEEAGRAGAGRRSVSAQLEGQISPFLFNILSRQARGTDPGDWELMLNNLMWADEKLKTTQIPARTLIEEALVASHLRKKLATFSG